jgi:hypothetical protein
MLFEISLSMQQIRHVQCVTRFLDTAMNEQRWKKGAHLVQKAKELMKHVPLSKHVHHTCVGPVPVFNDLHKVRQVMFQR